MSPRALLASVLLVAAGCECGTSTECNAALCPSNCCQAGVCVGGVDQLACGGGGRVCAVCALDEQCVAQHCVSARPVDPVTDASVDAGLRDAGAPMPDAGAKGDAGLDAGPLADAGAQDAGLDAGSLADAGAVAPDAGIPRDGGLTLAFELATIFPAGYSHSTYRWFRATDFNGDGLTDLVTGSEDDLTYILSDADAGLLAPVTLATTQYPCGLPADYTGDGLIDLLVDDRFQQRLMRGRGNGTFDAPVTVPYVLGLCGATVRPFDDGAELDQVGVALQRYRFDGTAFVDAGVSAGTTNYVLRSLAADFTGDGRLDLVSWAFDLPLTIFPATATSFAAPVVTLAPCNIRGAATGRFDTDAYADVAIATTCGAQVLFGSATGQLGRAVMLTALERAPARVAAQDLNADGLEDLVFLVDGRDANNRAPHFAAVFLNRGNGAFDYSERLTSPSDSYELIIGRFDRDALPDLYLTQTSSVAVASGSASSRFALGRLYDPEELARTSTWYGQGAVLVDVNRDGLRDAVVSGGRDGGIKAFLLDAQGRFTPGPMFTSGRTELVQGTSSGRFGATAAVAVGYATGTTVEVFDFSGAPDGGLARLSVIPQAVSFPYGAAPTFGDVDGDGVDELLFHQYDRVTLMWRSGPGTFTGRALPTAAGIGNVLVADLDGDGRGDVISGHYQDATVVIQRSLADGGFTDGGTFRSTTGQMGVSLAGDVTGDGLPDLLLRDYSSRQLWANTGSGEFVRRPDFPANAASMSLVDLDGDGRAEIVLGYGGGFEVYRQGPSSTSQLFPHASAGDQFLDVNGDGLADLVLSVSQGGFSVHLNLSR